jgi:hypothetical protein
MALFDGGVAKFQKRGNAMERALNFGLIFLLSCPGGAMAAGFGLKEHSAEAMGSSCAGAAASGSAQALSYNPASLAGVADNDVSISLLEILPSSSANYSVATMAAGTPASGTRNHVWSYDFVEAQRHDGRKVRLMTLIDEFTQECLAIRVGRRINSLGVIETMADVMLVQSL